MAIKHRRNCFICLSAFWIVHRAIKTYLDDDEGLVPTPYDTSSVKRAIFDYFGLQNNVDLLEPHYHFEKSHYSGLCKKLAERKSLTSMGYLWGESRCITFMYYSSSLWRRPMSTYILQGWLLFGCTCYGRSSKGRSRMFCAILFL